VFNCVLHRRNIEHEIRVQLCIT